MELEGGERRGEEGADVLPVARSDAGGGEVGRSSESRRLGEEEPRVAANE